MTRLFFGLLFLAVLSGYLCGLYLPGSESSGRSRGEEPLQADASGFSTMNQFRAVFVTVPSLEVGKKIATGLITQKLAACVNIIPQVTSIYEWEGEINEDSELILMIKTHSHHFEALSTFVKENYPYDVPEVIGLPIEQGSHSYLNWIKEVTDSRVSPSSSQSTAAKEN